MSQPATTSSSFWGLLALIALGGIGIAVPHLAQLDSTMASLVRVGATATGGLLFGVQLADPLVDVRRRGGISRTAGIGAATAAAAALLGALAVIVGAANYADPTLFLAAVLVAAGGLLVLHIGVRLGSRYGAARPASSPTPAPASPAPFTPGKATHRVQFVPVDDEASA